MTVDTSPYLNKLKASRTEMYDKDLPKWPSEINILTQQGKMVDHTVSSTTNRLFLEMNFNPSPSSRSATCLNSTHLVLSSICRQLEFSGSRVFR